MFQCLGENRNILGVRNIWDFYGNFCFQNAEFELHANQTQLDHMNNRGLQLLDDLKNIPNFDISVLEQDLDAVNHDWETANATIDEHKENLEAQLICWDQVTSGKEELESWVNTMVTKLDDSLQNFDDAVKVEACLAKYKVRFVLLYKEIAVADRKGFPGVHSIPHFEFFTGNFKKTKVTS